MPATTRLIAAMPLTPSVSTRSTPSKVLSIASGLVTVTSSSPSCSSVMRASSASFSGSIATPSRAFSTTRNRPLVLNTACAEATGMKIASLRSMPKESPRPSSTPMTRKR